MAGLTRLLAGLGTGIHRLMAPMWARLGVQPAVGNLATGAGVGATLDNLWGYITGEDEETPPAMTVAYTLGATVLAFLLYLGFKNFKRITK